MKTEIKVKCAGGCGYSLSQPNPFPKGSYCATYCCGCCPDTKTSPCQKDKTSGTFLDELKKWE